MKTKEQLQVGDCVQVQRQYFNRGGQAGKIVEIFPTSVALQFGLREPVEDWCFHELELAHAAPSNAAYQPAGGEASTESKSNERKP